MSRIASTISKIQRNINKIIDFLEPQKQFLNCHMVSFICDDLWETHIPDSIKKEVPTIEDVDSAIDLYFNLDSANSELIKKHQNLFTLIETSRKFRLETLDDKLFITTEELFEEFSRMGVSLDIGLNLSIPQFMKIKKGHEVEIAAKVIAALARTRNREHLVVDVGDGKGYLSSRLSLEYNLKVLGIDGNQDNTKQAEMRNQQLSKAWHHLVKKANKGEEIENISIKSESNMYKTTPQMVFADTELSSLVSYAFPDEDHKNICLTGLHTCGNLSTNSIKQFVKNDEMKLLCNVGCCYHLLYEEFETDFFNGEARIMDERDEPGFPMSNYLRSKGYKMGRNCRMVATQSYDKVFANKTIPEDSLIYRALLEMIIREKLFPNQEPKIMKVGKLRYKNFEDYFRKSCKKFNIPLTEEMKSAEMINELYESHKFQHRLINLLYLIRLLYAQTIEALILLDRYLYLLENNIDEVYLVKLFDPIISPRNYGFVAIKK